MKEIFEALVALSMERCKAKEAEIKARLERGGVILATIQKVKEVKKYLNDDKLLSEVIVRVLEEYEKEGQG